MKIRRNLTEKDFLKFDELERKFYSDDYITPKEECYLWYRHENLSYIAIEEDKKIVGFMCLFPIKDEVYKKIELGIYNDSNMTHKDILTTEEINTNDIKEIKLFLSCIVVDVGFRKIGVKFLLNEYLNIYNEFVKDGIAIKDVITDNVTKDGVEFSKRIGLEPILKSDHGTTICYGTFENIYKTNMSQ